MTRNVWLVGGTHHGERLTIGDALLRRGTFEMMKTPDIERVLNPDASVLESTIETETYVCTYTVPGREIVAVERSVYDADVARQRWALERRTCPTCDGVGSVPRHRL